MSIEGPQPTSELDARPVVRAAVAPPPVYGGTLEVVGDGAQAAITDPERNRVYVVDLDSRTVAHASTVYVACAGGGVVALDDDGSTTRLPTDSPYSNATLVIAARGSPSPNR